MTIMEESTACAVENENENTSELGVCPESERARREEKMMRDKKGAGESDIENNTCNCGGVAFGALSHDTAKEVMRSRAGPDDAGFFLRFLHCDEGVLLSEYTSLSGCSLVRRPNI